MAEWVLGDPGTWRAGIGSEERGKHHSFGHRTARIIGSLCMYTSCAAVACPLLLRWVSLVRTFEFDLLRCQPAGDLRKCAVHIALYVLRALPCAGCLEVLAVVVAQAEG